MAVSVLGSSSDNKLTANTTIGDFTHTVDSGTTFLILVQHLEGNEASHSTVPVWDSAGANEDFVLIGDSGLVGSGSDVRVYTWGIVSPTAGTSKTVTVRTAANSNPWWVMSRNYAGTEVGTVGAATNLLTHDQNTTPGTTGVHASGGASGSALIVHGSLQGNDGHPASNSGGYTEIYDTETGPDVTPDFSIYYAELLDSAPSAVTITWGASDQNTSSHVEILPASGGGGGDVPVFHHHRTLIKAV